MDWLTGHKGANGEALQRFCATPFVFASNYEQVS
jgi:hypothetical protein